MKEQVVPGAIVLGLTPTGLSVARSLGRRGIDVLGISASSDALGASSKYVQFNKSPDVEDEPELLAFLIGIAVRRSSKIVLLPTGDQNALFISKYRKELSEYFTFQLSSYELLSRVTSKQQFVQCCKELKLALPESYNLGSYDDLKHISSELKYPCVLKPEYTHIWQHPDLMQHGMYGVKAIRINDANHLKEVYEKVARINEHALVQEYVVGPEENNYDYHGLVDDDGRIVAEFVGRKLRLTPPYFGMGCYVESVKHEQMIEEGRTVLARLNFHGMANINFKKDERDGKFYLFEVNPRFSFWNGLDVACNVDFPYYYYCLCRKEKIAPVGSYKVGRRWLNLEADFKSMWTYSKDGTCSWFKWFDILFHPTVGAIWAWDDPAPGLLAAGRFLRTGIAKAWKSVLMVMR